MTEHQSTSTFIHLLRSIILLAALIVVPAMAVCWNMIPKDFFESEQYEQVTSAPDKSANSDSNELDEEQSAETVTVPFLPSVPQNTVSTGKFPSSSNSPNLPIKMMSGEMSHSTTEEQPIPNSFDTKPAIVHTAFAGTVPSYASEKAAQKSFPILESQLKQLGAKYYRLEKWGSRGELFRFSCYVTPSGPYQYQKYFQAIDSDELRVMENVIEEIKSWKK